MSDLSDWIKGINLETKRQWLQPNGKSAIVVCGAVVGGKLEWIEANTKAGHVTVPAHLYGDPKKFKPAQRQFVMLAEAQLEKFVHATRYGGSNGIR